MQAYQEIWPFQTSICLLMYFYLSKKQTNNQTNNQTKQTTQKKQKQTNKNKIRIGKVRPTKQRFLSGLIMFSIFILFRVYIGCIGQVIL